MRKRDVEESEPYRVLMDERWALEDLYGFPRAYSQVYDFVYCFDSEQQVRSAGRIDRALDDYPWQGGYSYVNFYTVLHHQVPPPHRPVIAAIRYASPGWMDILLQPDVAVQIARSVMIVLSMGVLGLEAVKRLDKSRLDIAKQRAQRDVEEEQLRVEEIKALNRMAEELARTMGFGSLEVLQARTNDPELTVKLLLAHYRRLRELADYVQSGKVSLPADLPNH